MKFILIDTVPFWYRETWKLFKKCGQDGAFAWRGHIHSETTTCAKAFITYIRVTVRARNVIAADVFGTGIFNEISCHKIGTILLPCASPFLRSSPLPHPASFKIRERS
jgi:hypothetical protein